MAEQPAAMLGLNTEEAVGLIRGFAAGDERINVRFSEIPGPWIYLVEGRLLNGRVAITSLTITPRDPDNPEPITKDTVRRTPVGSVLAWVKSSLRTRWEERVGHMATQARTHTIKRGRSWPAEHYLQVAWFAVHAELTGRKGGPRQMIHDHWGVEKITASRWMTRARQLGYLPEYPSPPPAPRSSSDAQIEATRMLEERIFDKVLRDGLTRVGPGSDESAAAQLLLRTVLGSSPEAVQVQTDIFAEQLTDLTESPEERVRRAAADLIRALAPE